MKISEMSLPSSEGFRPRPIIKNTHDGRILMILTIWGDASISEKLSSLLFETLEAATEEREGSEDPDATRVGIQIAPLRRKKSLDETFQESLHKIHHYLYTEVNKEEWVSCVEVLLMGYDQDYFYWSQAGQPQIFRSTDSGVEPISYIPDMSADMDQSVPLPFQALGLEKDIHLHSGAIPLGKTQQLILLSTPKIPGGLYITMGINLQAIVELIQQSFPNSPAWAGVIDFQAL